jgi:GNAT superfamily N-acetyltransferase
MENSFKIENTSSGDLPFIFELFDHSIRYQQEGGYPVWKDYDQGAIIRDIENGNQYKILVNDVVGIIFSVCYADKIIWREYDRGESVYLHRIVVNPQCKGQKLFGKILQWTIQHAHEKGLRNIRMDTWAANSNIIDYYKSFGFAFVEEFTTPDTPELPVHNRKLKLTLLEYKLPGS